MSLVKRKRQRLVITDEQAASILSHLKEAVQAKIDGWDAQRAIERTLGCDLIDMESSPGGIEDFAIGGAEGITVKDAKEFIESLFIDGDPPKGATLA